MSIYARSGRLGPLAADLDVGLVNSPARRLRPTPLPAQPFLHFWSESLHPAIDRGVVDRDAALSHHRFEVAVADRVAAVPAYCPEHDFPPEVTPLEFAHASTSRCRSRRHLAKQPDFATEPAGLRVRAELDKRKYPKGVTATDAEMEALSLHRNEFHGDWNYQLHPR